MTSQSSTTKASTAGTLGAMIRSIIGLMLLCGIIYPFVMTGVAQVAMPKQANGSLIHDERGQVIGSELIGQTFTSPQYFHGRVSSIEYNAAGSGSPNFAPSNPALKERLDQSVIDWNKANPEVPVSKLPVDLVTNSGSGLDPHISPEAADAQIPRIAKESGIAIEQLKQMVSKHTQSPDLGIFGEPRVNVLLLNLDVKQQLK
ncbi:potassium-transporting ATPase subunit KdpC [Paenibacillus sp. 481]|uniref:potassium-transporting ATPase subunit KdpC n=1 Tax=Paenibacillus sp. 481 TaxID=2835869 RepID=UPI001E65CEC2|nr:potassium-transporting ATPase subunit KdpC [Paenibacillus sp. 481]UHA74499.1 potassium-transporting ATPase subunit KdpC [Paenibacillus sp. 481]